MPVTHSYKIPIYWELETFIEQQLSSSLWLPLRLELFAAPRASSDRGAVRNGLGREDRVAEIPSQSGLAAKRPQILPEI